jgi:hypothetical protein
LEFAVIAEVLSRNQAAQGDWMNLAAKRRASG